MCFSKPKIEAEAPPAAPPAPEMVAEKPVAKKKAKKISKRGTAALKRNARSPLALNQTGTGINL